MSKTTLDNTFSLYIRLRDADQNGCCKCISCGKLIYWKEADAGHYINRKHMSLRYNEANVNAQCRSCNRFDEGNMEGYRRGLIEKYGPEIVDKLYAFKNFCLKLSKVEMSLLEKELNKKVAEIKKIKGIV